MKVLFSVSWSVTSYSRAAFSPNASCSCSQMNTVRFSEVLEEEEEEEEEEKEEEAESGRVCRRCW